MNDLYVAEGGHRLGPFDRSRLVQLARAGRLSPRGRVWIQGKEGWKPAGTVGEILDATTPPGRRVDPHPDAMPPLPGPEPGPEDPEDNRMAGAFSTMTGLGASLLGTASISLLFTEYAGFSMPLAVTALIIGNIGLLVDWFRDVARFSVSVMGVVAATAAISVSFVIQGGFDFDRYAPIVVTMKPDREPPLSPKADVPDDPDSAVVLLASGPDALIRESTTRFSRAAFRRAFCSLGPRVTRTGGLVKGSDLFAAFGRPARTRIDGSITYWSWRCNDGFIELAISGPPNPAAELTTGDELCVVRLSD